VAGRNCTLDHKVKSSVSSAVLNAHGLNWAPIYFGNLALTSDDPFSNRLMARFCSMKNTFNLKLLGIVGIP